MFDVPTVKRTGMGSHELRFGVNMTLRESHVPGNLLLSLNGF